jgi:hypothetical protein
MGSSSKQETKVPAYIDEAGKAALEQAGKIQAMGYTPYMGPDVAAINEYEKATSQNVGSMASAFGLMAPEALDMSGMPTVTQGGLTGYSSYPAMKSALERLRETRPDQYEYFSNLTQFDPITGSLNEGFTPIGQPQAPVAPMPQSSGGSGGGSHPIYNYQRPSYTSVDGGTTISTRPQARPSDLGSPSGQSGGLFSGLRSAGNSILDSLGVI